MENRSQGRRYLIIGIIMAVISLVAIVIVLGTAGDSDDSDGTAMVLIANQDIPPGTGALEALQANWLTLVNAPVEAIPPTGFIINGDEELREEAYDAITIILQDAVIIETVPAGNILPIGLLSWNAPLEIPPGYVAKGLQVNAISSVGGVVQAGDRVDLIASFENEFGTRKTKIVLQDILVLDVRGAESESGTLTINVPEGVEVIEETGEEEEGETTYESEGISRRSDYSPINLVPILAVPLEDAARVHYMETYADAVTLVIRHPGDPQQEVEDIIYDSLDLEGLLPDINLDDELLTTDFGGGLPEDDVDLGAMLDLLFSMIDTINQLQIEGVE